MQVLPQTAITSAKKSDFKKKNKFFNKVLQRALFKTLVIIIVFKISSKNSIQTKIMFSDRPFLRKKLAINKNPLTKML